MCVLRVSCCSPFGASAPRLRGTRCEIIQNNSCVQVFLYIVVLLRKIIKFICRFFGFSHRAPSAARSVPVRRPIGFRSPSDQIASAVRSDCVRCTTTNLEASEGNH